MTRKRSLDSWNTSVRPVNMQTTNGGRSHEENQERAYVAASRRSDRSIEARVQSAMMASEIHKNRTGKGLKISYEIVMNDEMYEEEDDDPPRSRRLLPLASHADELARKVYQDFASAFPGYEPPYAHHFLGTPSSSYPQPLLHQEQTCRPQPHPAHSPLVSFREPSYNTGNLHSETTEAPARSSVSPPLDPIEQSPGPLSPLGSPGPNGCHLPVLRPVPPPILTPGFETTSSADCSCTVNEPQPQAKRKRLSTVSSSDFSISRSPETPATTPSVITSYESSSTPETQATAESTMTPIFSFSSPAVAVSSGDDDGGGELLQGSKITENLHFQEDLDWNSWLRWPDWNNTTSNTTAENSNTWSDYVLEGTTGGQQQQQHSAPLAMPKYSNCSSEIMMRLPGSHTANLWDSFVDLNGKNYEV